MAAALALHGFAGWRLSTRSGGARKTKGDPRLRGDDIRLEPGGDFPPSKQNTIQPSRNT